MKYTIKTVSECKTDYIVEADTKDEALEKFYNGVYENENITDFENEDIISISEIENTTKDLANISKMSYREYSEAVLHKVDY